MTTLSFIDGQIRNLLWFHGDQNANIEDPEGRRAGLNNLRDILITLLPKKAAIELFNHKMTPC